MSIKPARRKVAEWHEQPRTWTCTLECGHELYGYEPVLDETKDLVDAQGYAECYECGRDEDRINELEGELRDLKRKRRTSRT